MSETNVKLADPVALAELGIAQREAGQLDAAALCFEQLMRDWPHLVFGWQEMAVLLARRGEDAEALALFERAAAINTTDRLTARHLATQQLKLGQVAAAQSGLRAQLATAPGLAAEDAAEISKLLAVAAFIAAHPAATLLAEAHRFETHAGFLGTEDVARRILAAVAAGMPFSLIRLGDGEGAWLPLSPTEAQLHAELYDANRRRTLQTWFGDTALLHSDLFAGAMARMAACAAAADLLGIPDSERLRHEYRLVSGNGIASNVRILRWLAAAPAARGQALCSQDIHIRLQIAGFYQKLLALPVEFGVISCHPRLGYQIVKKYAARVTRQLIVPEERGADGVAAGVTGLAGLTGYSLAHFPVVYQRVLQRLAVESQRGRVWLIAAGVLGKIYAGAVREAGGVALDIGSIADGWAGSVTRPYLHELGAFSL